MYAVIKNGGKQYRVVEGQTVKLERFDAEAGNSVDFNEVLMVTHGENVHVGTPLVQDAKVTAEVLREGRADKIEILKFRRRKHHMKRMGHRQDFTEVKITGIVLGGEKVAAKEKAVPKAKKAAVKKTAAKKKA